MTSPLRVLGICGSLRQKSFNMYALKAAGELMPPEIKLEITSIADIPMYNQDVQDKGVPAPVTKFRDEITQADGILIASPEYNFSLSGALKNAIDWQSRLQPMPFVDKPIALLSASGGPLGGARVQYDLRRILGQLYAFIMVRPEIFIGSAATKFDAEGRLTDEPTRKVLADTMVAFREWIRRFPKVPIK